MKLDYEFDNVNNQLVILATHEVNSRVYKSSFTISYGELETLFMKNRDVSNITI